ncbi:MAG: hypothetical protein AAF941_04990 [Pseudomonadota bacterium]
MIATTLTALFVVIAIATLLTFADCWVRGRYAFVALKRERALVKAGFVPVVEAEAIRLRQPDRIAPAATRSFARRIPSRARVAA